MGIVRASIYDIYKKTEKSKTLQGAKEIERTL